VFPHASGGSVEVVDGDPRLLWRTEDDAVARIGAIAGDTATRDEIRWRLRNYSSRFSAERFVDQFRAIVDAWSG
jgi:hypothetical protein